MKEVGRLFNDGILQLPFVLKSAEVMKKAVDMIKPYMQKDESATDRGTMVIATVAGDVHDIGKNLVDIILSNNGFKVVNLGTKVPIEQMMKAVREHKADVLGMSGLLVKSAAIMAENMKALEASDIRIPIFLGGAALTPEFVANDCQPQYSQPVVYCKDAFEGLTRMRELPGKGPIAKSRTRASSRDRRADEFDAPPVEIDLSAPPPEAARSSGTGSCRTSTSKSVYPYLNEIALVRGRWGYRRGKLSAEEYQKILDERGPAEARRDEAGVQETRPVQAAARRTATSDAAAKDETLLVHPAEGGKPIPLPLPAPEEIAVPLDPAISSGADEDVVGFMVVTLHKGLESENIQLLAKDKYQDYFLLHGFAVELTDALAEYWHARMREELGFADAPLTMQDYIVQKYRGSRYGFGYPACPDLSMNKTVCDLVHAAGIDVARHGEFHDGPGGQHLGADRASSEGEVFQCVRTDRSSLNHSTDQLGHWKPVERATLLFVRKNGQTSADP